MPLLEANPSALANGSLTQYTRAGLLVPELRESDTAGIIGELSKVLQSEGCVPDLLPFYHTALNQELLCNSAQQCGIAFPHARLSGIKALQFALGRTSKPVSWGGKGSWPVQLVFLLAVPATDAARYLHLLASIARLGQQPDLIAQLCAAKTAPGIFSILQKISTRANE
jgi:mannitol/fructose-specific phosphotransferase system IIA component (Ntr-type)